MFESAKFGYSYCDNGPIEGALLFNFALALLTYIICKTTNQYSWIDRIWSILPIGYAIHLIVHPAYCNGDAIPLRKIVMLIIITIWGVRLTYNYWRKGGFKKGGEDHRWPYLRNKWGGIRMELLLLFFVSFYQIYLIFWFSLPVYYITRKEFDTIDLILVVAAVLVLILEKTADDQQWEFQSAKKLHLKNETKDVPPIFKAGFITTGLFKYSRHPNFFAQITFWWIIAFFSLKDVGINASILGAIQLTLLFQGSTWLTQNITSERYPLYKVYQQNVSRFIPLPSPQDVLKQKNQ